MTLSLNPPKWTADWKPEEFRVRKYIFDTWRTVCESFWYQEYLWPVVEPAAIREAKSGEDVGGTELTKITNRDGEISDLALRPEMTPTVTRMIAKYQREYTKPIRWFSIANFYRNERPQRGRNREFWQCNVDIFGTESQMADVEVLQMSIELMKSFGSHTTKEKSFELRINHRDWIWRVIWLLLWLDKWSNPTRKMVYWTQISENIVRLLDKRDKLSEDSMITSMWKIIADYPDIWLDEKEMYEIFKKYIECESINELIEYIPDLKWSARIQDLDHTITSLEALWYSQYIQFTPWLMRWFDYYDGMVFEVFDLHSDNNRALFGWGRYNWLADIFGVKEPVPAVWFAPGDEPMRLFLESWELLPEDLSLETYYIPLLDETKTTTMLQKAQELRAEGKRVEVGMKVQSEQKAFEYAKKKGIGREFLIIV